MKNNLYKKSIALMIVFLLLTNLIMPIVYATGEEEIEFTDSEFEQIIINNGRDSNWESIDKDENGKISKQEMESLFEIGINCYNINSLEDLKYAKNLKMLSLYQYDKEIDLSIIKQITGLVNFDINGNNVTVSKISEIVTSLPNLSSLGVSIYNENGLDLAELATICGNISELNLSGNIKNINGLANMQKLEYLNLNNNSETPTTDEIIDVIKNIELTSFCVGSNINVDLGSFQEGENVAKNFSEISPVMNYVFDEENYLYSPESYYDTGYDNIQIDNNNKTVTISTNVVGNQYSYIYCSGGKFSGNINLSWKVMPQGDAKTEINIPDNNLKQQLLRENDVDKDGKITEIDLKSITSLGIYNSVTNLEGLQYMTNLRQLSISGGNQGVIDITPILGLKNLESLYIQNNNITDISFLLNFEKLTYANLTRNPINPEETNNKNTIDAIKQRGGNVELSQYDTTPNIIFVNQNLKKALLSNNDINRDGEISEYEMSQISSINVQGKLDDLKYATNLSSLSVGITNETTDLSMVFTLKKLYNLYISAYSNGNNETRTIDISEINKLTNLQEFSLSGSIIVDYSNLPSTLKRLSISTYNNESLDMNQISILTNLNSLSISAKKIENIEKISKFTELTSLTININQSYSEDAGTETTRILDLSNLEKLTKLTSLDIYGTISNIQSLKKLTNLTRLSLSPYNPTNEEISEIIGALSELNIQEIRLSGSYKVDLGTFNLGSNQDPIKIKNLNAITNAIYTEGSKIYIENPNWRTYSSQENILVGDAIQIDTSKVGDKSIHIYLSGYNSRFSGSINVTWKVVEDGDKTKEINIPDENFRKVLLDSYDIDKNKKITEYDLINIDYMDIGMSDIQSLDGIQNCRNLQTLYAMDNEISDLSPIANMQNLEFAVFSRNKIQNIDCLENAKFSLNRIDLSENYIDTSKGSKAYNILKNSYINEIKKDEETAQYINDNDILEQMDDYIINSQNYGSYEDRNLEVSMEDAMKQKLIELGLDKDKNGKLTREELYNAQNEIYELDLSGLGIKDISPLKYINVYAINLSNNNITDISAVANKRLHYIDLSNNKISNISVIKELYDLTRINLSNNNISNITTLSNMPYLKYKHFLEIGDGSNIYVYEPQYGMGIEYWVSVDLSQNYIDVNETNNKNALASIDTEMNRINLDNQKEKTGLIGDINGDGKVSLLDYGLVLAHVKKTKLLTGEQLQRADVNGDNKVTLLDYGLILAHVKKTKLLF